MSQGHAINSEARGAAEQRSRPRPSFGFFKSALVKSNPMRIGIALNL